jgi:transposase InsO family protein
MGEDLRFSVELLRSHTPHLEVFVPHANAPLTELGRLRLARCVVEDGWSLRRAAERFQVSHNTARRWADRYRQQGEAGMVDRSSRPHRSPRRTPRPVERQIGYLRQRRRLGPAAIAGRLGMHASTVHRVLVRAGAPRLAHVDLATGQPIRRTPAQRYERDRPGELVHVDIKKLGRIPDGGGWRVHGRALGGRHSRGHTPQRRNNHPVIGYGYLHAAIDDHSRLAYAEILADETGATAAAFWRRAHAWFAGHGITVERVMTDNGACYRSHPWRDVLADAGITHKRTRPYRPQTNGKIERFNRTLALEWAYAKAYRSEKARRKALPRWLHIYNHHRPHTALRGQPPASRVPNLSGQNI